MKTNRSMKVAIIVIALTLITSCFVGTTFAKYASSSTGTSTGTVAAWKITVNDTETTDIAKTNTFVVDLFNHTDEGVTVAADRIAPGTTGSFAFALTNDSEVNAEYKITFAETKNLEPIEFSLNGTDGWTKDISTLDFNGGEATDFTALDMGDTSSNVTIYWRWAFGDDASIATDTPLGLAAAAGSAAECVVTITVDVQQVD